MFIESPSLSLLEKYFGIPLPAFVLFFTPRIHDGKFFYVDLVGRSRCTNSFLIPKQDRVCDAFIK